MKSRSYGIAQITDCSDGSKILILPKSLIRDLRLHLGDTITLQRLNKEGLQMRFYRKVKRKWLRLLPGGVSRTVKAPL